MAESQPPSLAEVLAVLDGLYPPDTAQSWDRVGLVSGDPDQVVHRIHLAVDPTLAVIEEAREAGANLLITHHPLLLRGIHSVATTTAKGAAVTALVVADLALYVAHTNADVARPGVNDALAEAAGLETAEPLVVRDGVGLGLVGELPTPMTLTAFAAMLAEALPASPVGIRVSGDPEGEVRRVAVLGGAGDDAFAQVRASGADVYVTADLRHHPALEAREEARGGTPYLIDAGHWATESLWLRTAADRIRDGLADRADSVDLHVSALRTDPWDFLVPTGATTHRGSGGPR
ncbi:Nif3-like dinuclear metal center hexameric protein [Luteipulveratus flavus]|uniref:GTP cyclohydrolase 1 type 2 homolog n=1 Tax=Luteipulveratus flavus TaxID=3031728 RepID=A0ABT6C3P2_9MICO|nr:Nif3-like dinuclear metal center hexameric protein [Luteipulveratus sp. YIM 133296]MDF8263423.1 Nif3-like dinuclear metal center hexameric protein [Luteipulveratus sp. YIM 133296]